MSDPIHLEFPITGRATWLNFINWCRTHLQSMVISKRNVRIIITDEDADRLEEQVRYYFGVLLAAIANQAHVNGQQFSKEVWHEYLATKFLPGKEVEMPDGEYRVVRSSVARGKIGVKAMAEYTKQVEAYAATELGVQA